MDADPAIFVIDLQDAKKRHIFFKELQATFCWLSAVLVLILLHSFLLLRAVMLSSLMLLVGLCWCHSLLMLASSVADPDTYGFAPPGSGSISVRSGSGSFKQKL
jgi:hypothetical protein